MYTNTHRRAETGHFCCWKKHIGTAGIYSGYRSRYRRTGIYNGNRTGISKVVIFADIILMKTKQNKIKNSLYLLFGAFCHTRVRLFLESTTKLWFFFNRIYYFRIVFFFQFRTATLLIMSRTMTMRMMFLSSASESRRIRIPMTRTRTATLKSAMKMMMMFLRWVISRRQ